MHAHRQRQLNLRNPSAAPMIATKSDCRTSQYLARGSVAMGWADHAAQGVTRLKRDIARYARWWHASRNKRADDTNREECHAGRRQHVDEHLGAYGQHDVAHISAARRRPLH